MYRNVNPKTSIEWITHSCRLDFIHKTNSRARPHYRAVGLVFFHRLRIKLSSFGQGHTALYILYDLIPEAPAVNA